MYGEILSLQGPLSLVKPAKAAAHFYLFVKCFSSKYYKKIVAPRFEEPRFLNLMTLRVIRQGFTF
jgi:hypothetical protein